MTKRKLKPHKSSEKFKKYKISGSKLEKGKTCPKCGPGMFLANHKDRVHCGHCGYSEFTKK